MVSELALFEDKILGIRVKGVMGTNSAKIKEADDNGMFYDSTTGVFVKRDEWSISAEGSNIESVFTSPVWTSSAPSPTTSWLCTTVLESKLREMSYCRSSRSCTLEIPMPITDTSFSSSTSWLRAVRSCPSATP
jgi:hypothetical protein